jgi:hypothetical protein
MSGLTKCWLDIKILANLDIFAQVSRFSSNATSSFKVPLTPASGGHSVFPQTTLFYAVMIQSNLKFLEGDILD